MNNNSQETPMNNRPANHHHLSSATPEESSWTSYFEEFLWQKKNDDDDDDEQDMIMSTCDHHETLKSLVSDAASSVKKAVCIQDDGHGKKLRLIKKRKTKGSVMIDDDSLEDTASSPINSPKAAYFSRDKTKNKNEKTLHNSEEKDGTIEEENKRRVLNPNMELKKRGLCLVPLSSLVNYLS